MEAPTFVAIHEVQLRSHVYKAGKLIIMGGRGLCGTSTLSRQAQGARRIIN